jgi:hypothetical protein
VNNNVWKVIVLILGIPMAAISVIAEWNQYQALPVLEIIGKGLLKSFLYAASASLSYQTAKLTKKSVSKKI